MLSFCKERINYNDMVGMTRTGVVLGLHFAERNLDAREYLRIIHYNVIQRDFHIHNVDRNVMWWQQGGASSHTSNAECYKFKS